MALGIALSGGGAKGAAHIGVLQALMEENINIDYISGTSSGSIIASLYACGYTPKEMLQFFNMYCNQIGDYDKLVPFKVMGTVVTGNIALKGLAKGDRLENIINNFFMKKKIFDISQVKMPIAIPTVDINTGEVVYFVNKKIEFEQSNRENFDDIPTYKFRGNLASIVRASSSFPVVFEPKILDGRVLVDGGVRVNTPISVLKKMGADKVIAISFDKNKRYNDKSMNIISISLKAFDIMSHQVNDEELNRADLIIRPNLPKNISLLDCKKSNLLANLGYRITKEKIKDINNLK